MESFPWWDERHIQISWGLREESAEICAARLARFLALIEPLHPAITSMRWVLGPVRSLYPLPERSEKYAPLFEPLRDYDDVRKCRYANGFRFRADSRFGSDRFLLLHIHAGRHRDDVDFVGPKFGANSLSLATVVKDLSGEDAPLLAVFPALLRAAIDAWEPDCGGLYSYNFLPNYSPGAPRPFADGSWAIYLAPRLARKMKPPRSSIVESLDDGGLLMLATDGCFREGDQQRTAAEAIHAAIAPLELSKF